MCQTAYARKQLMERSERLALRCTSTRYRTLVSAARDLRQRVLRPEGVPYSQAA
jgi:hypothetical protein